MTSRMIFLALILGVVVSAAAPAVAMQTPSKTVDNQSLAERQADLITVQAVITQPEVAEAIAQQGFTTDEVNERLAQLSPEELHTLSMQLDQLHAAGVDVPKYVWILLAVFLGVLIFGAIF